MSEPTDEIFIGSLDGSSLDFHGQIGELVIYNSALTDNQAMALRVNSGKPKVESNDNAIHNNDCYTVEPCRALQDINKLELSVAIYLDAG